MTMFTRIARWLAAVAMVGAVAASIGSATAAAAEPESAESIYGRALGRERELRDDGGATLAQLRWVVRKYETVVRRFPKSGYTDNALWQGANLAILAFERFGNPADRQTAVRLLTLLRHEYPSSPFRPRVAGQLEALETPRPAAIVKPTPPPVLSTPLAGQLVAAEPVVPKSTDLAAPAPATPTVATIKEIKRVPLPDGVRVSIELDAELAYRHEQLEHPRRVFFDLEGRADDVAAPGRGRSSSTTTWCARSGWDAIPGTRPGW